MKESEYKEFWDQQHSNGELLWLTGTPALGVFNVHDIVAPINIVFMDIGVGFGDMCRYQKELGNKVYAVDVSTTALDKVKNWSHRQIHVSELGSVEPNTVDLAVCHLVMQHCSDSMCQHIIENVFNALKPNGTLSIQFAGVDDASRMDTEEGSDVCHGYFRSPNKMMELAKNIQPTSITISDRQTFTTTPIYWQIMKITK